MAKSKQSSYKNLLSKLFFHLFIFLLLMLVFILFTLPFIHSPDDSQDTKHSALIEKNEDDVHDDQVETEILSWRPRASLLHNFLTKAECEHLINISKPHLQRSYVFSKEGKPIASRYGHFLNWGQDEVVSSIEDRIAKFTFIPKENGEPIQILRYEAGQEYLPHVDYFSDKVVLKLASQRIATVLMYLTDVEEGGETAFPYAKGNFSMQRNDLSECARNKLAVKPRMGDALLFWSMKPNGTLDSESVHVGCPVIKGTKWSATKWICNRKLKRTR